MNKQIVIIIGLAVGLALVTGFFGMEKLTQRNQAQLESAFQQGYELGIVDVGSTIFEKTNDCKIAPLVFKNVTRGIVDVDCLKRSQTPPLP